MLTHGKPVTLNVIEAYYESDTGREASTTSVAVASTLRVFPCQAATSSQTTTNWVAHTRYTRAEAQGTVLRFSRQ